ncbi:hypothetical protein SUGI_0855400 [Cryptomeria japonica]|nr:hypothetical protein SUGI_0855400 [Cryptomeria japonica]
MEEASIDSAQGDEFQFLAPVHFIPHGLLDLKNQVKAYWIIRVTVFHGCWSVDEEQGENLSTIWRKGAMLIAEDD